MSLEDSANRVIPSDKELDSELDLGGSVEREREDSGLACMTGGGLGNSLGVKGRAGGQHGSVSDAGVVNRGVVEKGAGALSVEEMTGRSMLSQEETGKLAVRPAHTICSVLLLLPTENRFQFVSPQRG